MNQNKLSFKSENLVVDWIGLNIKDLIDAERIGKYLFEIFGFNCQIKKSKNERFEYLFYKTENKFEVSFLVCHYEEFYWKGRVEMGLIFII